MNVLKIYNCFQDCDRVLKTGHASIGWAEDSDSTGSEFEPEDDHFIDDGVFEEDGAKTLIRAPDNEPTDRAFLLQHASRVEMDSRLADDGGVLIEDGGVDDELPFEEAFVASEAMTSRWHQGTIAPRALKKNKTRIVGK